MRCKDCDKLIHLYLDQQLGESKRKEIQEHLSECPRCKEKFEALKAIEEKARGIEIPEPEEAYWQTFSQRVRERIAAKQRQPFGIRLKEFVGNVFVFTPQKLRIAAAVASIVLVFIVGKLYIDYRGTIPEKIKPVEEEMPKPERIERAVQAPAMPGEKPPPAPEQAPPKTEKKGATVREPAEIKEQVTQEEIEIPAPPIQPESKEVAAGAGAELAAKKAVTRDIAKEEPVAGVMEQEVAMPVEKAEAPKVAMRAMADVKEKEAKPRSKVSCEFISYQVDIESDEMSEPHMYRCLLPDSAWVPDVDWAPRNLSADSLRVIINVWRKFIEENPDDPFVEQAYLQIAASYYHIFNKTKDETIRVEGIKQIQEFLKVSENEEIKEGLRQRLEELENSKEK